MSASNQSVKTHGVVVLQNATHGPLSRNPWKWKNSWDPCSSSLLSLKFDLKGLTVVFDSQHLRRISVRRSVWVARAGYLRAGYLALDLKQGTGLGGK